MLKFPHCEYGDNGLIDYDDKKEAFEPRSEQAANTSETENCVAACTSERPSAILRPVLLISRRTLNFEPLEWWRDFT